MLLPNKVAAQTFQEMSYTPQQTQFTLFAPNDAKKVTVRIYQEGQGGKAIKTVKMQRTANEKWTATVKGDLMGKFYTLTWDVANALASLPRPLVSTVSEAPLLTCRRPTLSTGAVTSAPW